MNVDEIMTMVILFGQRYASNTSDEDEAQLRDIDAAIKALVPDPNTLTLPTPPPGTIALIGVESGRRYEKTDIGIGWEDKTTGQVMPYERVLMRNEPKGVRAEQAPPPAPRTAVEVWKADPGRFSTELADALDREAGIA